MPDPREMEVIEDLRERASRNELADVTVTFQISGGMPAERLEQQVRVAGSEVRLTRRGTDVAPREASAELSQDEKTELFTRLAAAVPELVPRSEARFIPDSVVGSFVVEVGGRQAEFFFLVDEEERTTQQQPVPPEASDAITSFSRLAERLVR